MKVKEIDILEGIEPVQMVENDQGDYLLIYESAKGAKVELKYNEGSLWLTQPQMADLFGVTQPAVSKHLTNIYEVGELYENATHSKMERVACEGNRKVKRSVDVYSLDAVISVGYRVNSVQGTQSSGNLASAEIQEYWPIVRPWWLPSMRSSGKVG